MFESLDKEVLYKMSGLSERQSLVRDKDLAPMLACIDEVKTECTLSLDDAEVGLAGMLEVVSGVDAARRILINIFGAAYRQ